MKPTAISADVLFEDHRANLKWEWVAGLGASERRFDEVAVQAARSGADLVGYLNYIHPYRVQILGEREVAYLLNAGDDACVRRISRIITLEPPVLIMADGQTAPDALLSMPALLYSVSVSLLCLPGSLSRTGRSDRTSSFLLLLLDGSSV